MTNFAALTPARTFLRAFVVFALSLLANAPVHANASDPWRAGYKVGEPTGDLKFVRIERETLSIDLRPLAQSQPATVEAIYLLRSEGEARTLNLVFVADALAEGESGVWLDGAALPSERVSARDLPPSWRAPSHTPALEEGGTPIPYQVYVRDALSFRLTLAPGEHTLRVRYHAAVTAYSSESSPTLIWQLGYILSPARDWSAFGGLDVRVDLPAGWSAASTPALQREGDTLTASWNEIPADTIALTVQAPPPVASFFYAALKWLALVGGLFACVLLGAFVGRWLGRRRRTSAWALPVSLVLACAWAIAFFFTFQLPSRIEKQLAGSQASSNYRFGYLIVGLIISVIILFAGVVLTQTKAFLARRKVVKSLK